MSIKGRLIVLAAIVRNVDGELVPAFEPRQVETAGRERLDALMLGDGYAGIVAWSGARYRSWKDSQMIKYVLTWLAYAARRFGWILLTVFAVVLIILSSVVLLVSGPFRSMWKRGSNAWLFAAAGLV